MELMHKSDTSHSGILAWVRFPFTLPADFTSEALHCLKLGLILPDAYDAPCAGVHNIRGSCRLLTLTPCYILTSLFCLDSLQNAFYRLEAAELAVAVKQQHSFTSQILLLQVPSYLPFFYRSVECAGRSVKDEKLLGHYSSF